MTTIQKYGDFGICVECQEKPATEHTRIWCDDCEPLFAHESAVYRQGKPSPPPEPAPKPACHRCHGTRYIDGGGTSTMKHCPECNPFVPAEPAGREEAAIEVGDWVKAVPPFALACGSGLYDGAVAVSVSPLILVSEQGDMLWSATLYPGCVRSTGTAPVSAIVRANERYGRHLLATPPAPTSQPAKETDHAREAAEKIRQKVWTFRMNSLTLDPGDIEAIIQSAVTAATAELQKKITNQSNSLRHAADELAALKTALEARLPAMACHSGDLLHNACCAIDSLNEQLKALKSKGNK